MFAFIWQVQLALDALDRLVDTLEECGTLTAVEAARSLFARGAFARHDSAAARHANGIARHDNGVARHEKGVARHKNGVARHETPGKRD